MRKNLLVILFALSAITLSVFAWLLFVHEPAYQGKSLNAWLDQYGSNHWNYQNHELDRQAEAAIRHFGTNLIPKYLKTISAHPSRFKTYVLGHVPSGWHIRFHIPSVNDYEHALDLHRNRGAFGLVALGADAKTAVPVLVGFLNDRSASVRHCSLFALCNLGSAAHDALPSFIEYLNDQDKGMRLVALIGVGAVHADPGRSIPALIDFIHKNSGDSTLRYMAINALGLFETNGAAAVPVLLESFKDPDANIRRVTIFALGNIRAQPGIVVPLLAENLNHEKENPANFRLTFRALGQYGSEARSALPALRQFTTNGDVAIQKMALSALKEIDPDGAIAAKGLK